MSKLGTAHTGESDFVVGPRYAANATPLVTAVRSTALLSSIKSMAALGILDAYAARLPTPRMFTQLRELLPATWVDISVARAHYEALDGLQLSDLSRVALAKQAGDMVEAYLTGTIVRMSRGLGVNPWMFHPHAQRLWDRMCQGGDISVARLGPKEAQVTLYGMPLVGSRYFRMAMCATWAQSLERVCKKAYVRELSHGETSASFRQSWV